MAQSYTRRLWILATGIGLLGAQEPEFVCPMDRDVHSPHPGNCPRCGMKLVAGLPMPVEYPMEFRRTHLRSRPAATLLSNSACSIP